MEKKLFDDFLNFMRLSGEESIRLIEQICKIPAPSLHEDKRALFCKNWLRECGAEGVYTDSAQNVFSLKKNWSH